MFRLHRGYALAAMALFVVEAVIALCVRDRFVRPYLGDVLAVLLVHCGLRAVTQVGIVPAAVAAFGIAVLVELGQLIGFLDLLGWRSCALARTLLGTGFDWKDLVAYAAGVCIAAAVEKMVARR